MRRWMRRAGMGWLLAVAMAGASMPAFGVDRMAVTYVNGTVKAAAEDASALLDTSSGEALRLQVGTAQASIPYGAVVAYEYNVENRFRLGALGTVAVGLLKARSKRHRVVLSWKDEDGTFETATFEASRDRARSLIQVLDLRAPQVRCSGRRNVNW